MNRLSVDRSQGGTIPMFAIRLTRRRIIAAVAMLAGVNIAMLIGTHLARASEAVWWPAQLAALQVNLARENNVAVWYASMPLLTAALAMFACFITDRRGASAPRERTLAWGWLVGAGMFALLSLDEAGSLHERINSVARTLSLTDTLRVESPGWVGVLAIPIGIAGLFLLAFAWFHVRRVPVAFLLLSSGTLLFLTVPIQEHLEVARWTAGASGLDARATTSLLLEEGAELFGALCFAAGAGWYAATRASRAPGEWSLSFHRSAAIGAVILLGAGFVAVELILPSVMAFAANGTRGIPENWFPAVLALLVSLTSIGLWLKRGRQDRWSFRSIALGLFGAAHLALSMDHGAAHEFTEDMLSSTPRKRMIVDLLIVTALAITASALAAAWGTGGAVVAGLWLGLLLVPFWAGAELRPVVGFAAYGIMLSLLAGRDVVGAAVHRTSRPATAQRVRTGVAP